MRHDSDPVEQFLVKLEVCRDQPPSAQHHVRSIAEALQSLLPASPVILVWIFEANSTPLALDNNGIVQEGWAAALQPALANLQLAGRHVVRIELPSDVNLPARQLMVAGMVHRNHCYGMVGAALPEDVGPASHGSSECLLKMAAGAIASRLRLDLESVELHERASLGDLAAPLAHECNNFLNVVLLQVAVLEMDIPGAFAPQLEEIRRQGNRFQKLVEQFHAYRNTRPATLSPVHLEVALENVAHEQQVRIVSLVPLPRVLASANDLQHLLRFLSSHGARCGGASLEVESVAGKVLLSLCCPNARADADSLDWCACQSLTRRLQGKSYCHRRADGGTDYVVELKSADEGGTKNPSVLSR